MSLRNLKTSPEMSFSPEMGNKYFGCCKVLKDFKDFAGSWSVAGSWPVTGVGATKKLD
ncbi:hypothetical protein ACS0TY_020559 [Phlomoides rotata]